RASASKGAPVATETCHFATYEGRSSGCSVPCQKSPRQSSPILPAYSCHPRLTYVAVPLSSQTQTSEETESDSSRKRSSLERSAASESFCSVMSRTILEAPVTSPAAL